MTNTDTHDTTPVTRPITTEGQQGDTFPPSPLAAVELADVPGFTGPLTTRSIDGLDPVVILNVPADRVGIHRPVTGRDGMLLTIAGTNAAYRTVLDFPDDPRDVDRLVTLLGIAARDEFGGDFTIQLRPSTYAGAFTAINGRRVSNPEGWQIATIAYRDTEGVGW